MKGLVLGIWRWVDERTQISRVVRATLTEYMVPANLNFWYTMGSLLLACFVIQIVTGILLLIYYVPETSKAFESVKFITSAVPYGWLIRRLHAMTANLFVLVLFLHMLSTLYMGSYKKPREIQWMTGVILFGLVLTEALSGYLLPWSQLSYWATTVATNAIGSIPKIGDMLVVWVRGTPKVSQFTLGRFFAMHVSLIPFTILMFIAIHLLFMRLTGISAPPGTDKAKVARVPFFPHMVSEDLTSLFIFLAALTWLVFFFPQFAFPPDALEPANPLQTPAHIKPEWYCLANYQALKLVPNEFLGILVQLVVGVILFFLPFLDRSPERRPLKRPVFTTLVTLGLLAYIALAVWGHYS
ncbi:MAG: cytochrome bc complex cytochrome b subunit [Candidatus Hydrothermae bacterium]|nr:cytochrome bc complex cytochrome b subunit [Candidatus Hydrothermae bacterium]